MAVLQVKCLHVLGRAVLHDVQGSDNQAQYRKTAYLFAIVGCKTSEDGRRRNTPLRWRQLQPSPECKSRRGCGSLTLGL